MHQQLIETWQIHDRINLYLLDAIAESSLANVSASKGRNVYQQLAHMHNIRLAWLKAAAPELMKELEKFDTEKLGTKAQLAAALKASGAAIEKLLAKGFAEGKVKNFKPHGVAFLGYMISHESHHRGQIGWTLKQSGVPLDKKVGFGLWEWGTR